MEWLRNSATPANYFGFIVEAAIVLKSLIDIGLYPCGMVLAIANPLAYIHHALYIQGENPAVVLAMPLTDVY